MQAQKLETLGARVYLPADNEGLDWSLMAGYDEQKSLIEDLILIGLKNPEVYQGLAQQTRKDKTAQRPKVGFVSLASIYSVLRLWGSF